MTEITEVRVKDESEVMVLPHAEIFDLCKEGKVEAVYKYGAFDRELIGEVKTVHNLTQGPYKGYDSSRPRASSVITSSSVDRDGDIVSSAGMIISDAYMHNPIVLPMHSRDFPVGMTRRLKQSKKSVWAEWEWLVDQDYTQAKTFQQAWDAYVLNSTSIGFLPVSVERNEDGGGLSFLEWELLEHSPVIIPAQQDAMRTDGLKTLLKAFGEAIMDGPNPIAKRLWEEALERIRPKQVAVSTVPVGRVVTISDSSADTMVPMIDEGTSISNVEEDMEEKRVIPYKRTPLAPENEPWDAAREVAAASVDDLKIMCTWVDAEKPDIKGSYKLPHHKASGSHQLVWRGVAAAMGTLLGARGGVNIPDSDRRGVYNHLVKHYKEFDKEPPEFREYEETVDGILGAYAAGILTREEARSLIEKRLDEAEERAQRYKREAEELAARVIERR